ncbi:MAG: UxaA family hydrolase [Christensenellales bacterium]|jgi:altronate dehydratase small subunit
MEKDRSPKDGPAAFQIDIRDNVATALTPLPALARVDLRGDAAFERTTAGQDIPLGHKIALRSIAVGEEIIKYGIVIGLATQAIPQGGWVHLHCMKSLYDERSSHLDGLTGAPKDIKYE